MYYTCSTSRLSVAFMDARTPRAEAVVSDMGLQSAFIIKIAAVCLFHNL
jgi:hypothetical protein